MSLHIPEIPDDADVCAAALLYARAGWYVLPVRPGVKHAGSVLGSGWPEKTSRDPQQIVAWFAGESYSLALHVGRSGAVAFDVDHVNALPRELVSVLADTAVPYQSTRPDEYARGHYLFAAPAGSIGNSGGELGSTWGDVRGLNGILIVAPSEPRYRWVRTGPVPALPEALRAVLRPPGHAVAAADEPAVRAFLEGLEPGEPCRAVSAIALTMPASGRHETMNARTLALVRLGDQGHQGAGTALARLAVAFVAAVTPDRAGGAAEAEAEWHRGLAGAVAEVMAAPTLAADRGCCVPDNLPDVSFDAPIGGDAGASEPVGMVGGGLDPADALLGELLDSAAIAAQAPPVSLIKGLLFMNTLAWMIGKSGSFKSFVALDIAQHVALGRAWAGRRTQQGVVLYVAAEGAGGMTLRVRAWEKSNGTASPNVKFLPRPVQANSGEWNVLIEVARRLKPVLIVCDTQARITVGIKENDNTEMGMFVQQVDRLRRATEACVLLVHHIGRSGDDARGASAIDGAQDTELKIERIGGAKSMDAKLTTDKQKDAPDTEAVAFKMLSVSVGTDHETGEPVTSLVVNTQTFIDAHVAPWLEKLPERQGRILDVMTSSFDEHGATASQVLAILHERGWSKDYPKSSFYYAWNALIKKDRIEKVAGTERWLPAITADPTVTSEA